MAAQAEARGQTRYDCQRLAHELAATRRTHAQQQRRGVRIIIVSEARAIGTVCACVLGIRLLTYTFKKTLTKVLTRPTPTHPTECTQTHAPLHRNLDSAGATISSWPPCFAFN